MAQNTYKTQPKPPKPPRKRESRLYNYLNRTFGLEKLIGEDNPWPIEHFGRIVWVAFLIIIYIGSNHNAERLVRRLQKTKAEVDELRAHYTTLQAAFMKTGKQSEIRKQVEALGLGESQVPPQIIVVKPEEEQ